MSCNEMIVGYAIPVGHTQYLEEEQIDKLYDNFDSGKLHECQFMPDTSGTVFAVYLVASDSDYCGSSVFVTTIEELIAHDRTIEAWMAPQGVEAQGDIRSFHIDWYNGSDRMSIENVK